MLWLPFIFLIYFLCLLVERALVGVSSHDLDALRNEDSPFARHALTLSAKIRPTLTALLLARIFLISGAGILVVVWWQGQHEWKTALTRMLALPESWIGVAAGTALVLGLALVFWALQKTGMRITRQLRPAQLLKRLWWVALFWNALFGVLLRKHKSATLDQTASEGGANDQTGINDTSEKRELELLKSIVQFGDVTVKQVMQSRSKVVFVDFKLGFHELLEVVRNTEFSRLPVCDEDLDNVTGILYVKDLVAHLDKENSFEWQPLIRTNLLMVPEAKRGSELLREFKQLRMHMALVVDEYGGVAGIVTMEDILEEVTGDIRDEFDEESEIRYRKIDDFNYLFEGQTLLNDVCRITGIPQGTFDLVRGASDTLAGLTLELRGDIPQTGTEVAWGGFLLTVTGADKRRIEQIKLSLPKENMP